MDNSKCPNPQITRSAFDTGVSSRRKVLRKIGNTSFCASGKGAPPCTPGILIVWASSPAAAIHCACVMGMGASSPTVVSCSKKDSKTIPKNKRHVLYLFIYCLQTSRLLLKNGRINRTGIIRYYFRPKSFPICANVSTLDSMIFPF